MTTDTTQPRVEDGGPASGMSMRDYFAAAALPAMIGQFGSINETIMPLAAKDAYELADAMLRARSEGGK